MAFSWNSLFVSTTVKVVGIAVMIGARRPLHAFQVSSKHVMSTKSNQRGSLLRSVPSDYLDEEYEAARQQFEKLMTEQRLLLENSDTAQQSQLDDGIKPLTASSKRQKELEIRFLEDLVDSDDAIDPLVDLWVGERSDAAEQLKVMETTCSPGLQREEHQLRQMITRYGPDWVEPMNRLSLLLFTKGTSAQVEEAKVLCGIALDIKPWHFEAAQLLVMIHLRQGDFQQALRITRNHCLPPLNVGTGNKRRRTWVNRYLAKAREMLQEAQTATIIALQDDSVDDLCSLVETDEDFCWQ